MSSIGVPSRYITYSDMKSQYFNQLVYQRCPNPISSAYSGVDLGEWQEFKEKTAISTSNQEAISIGSAVRNLSGGIYNPVRAVFQMAGASEQFQLVDETGVVVDFL